jgi:hypothetical protein
VTEYRNTRLPASLEQHEEIAVWIECHSPRFHDSPRANAFLRKRMNDFL